ncbi:MAG: glycoside hydrolase family 88 protein [Clostridia bacterium]|nr:glycoside hydrolase family 88 protein [Clostridia bacterium]
MDIKKAYEMCLAKTERHMELHKGAYEYGGRVFEGKYEEECTKNTELNSRVNWMTSFVTGMGVLAYRTTKEQKYLDWANKYEQAYHDKIFHHFDVNPIHDLGFLYSPYSVGLYMETRDERHKLSALRAADELAKRFDIDGRYIDSWTNLTQNPQLGRAIIDTMMNLPLLFWAWKETGHIFYYQVAKAHAETTAKYFIRDDDTVVHSFDFERGTGKILQEHNDCGYGNGSYWARGTAWAIYGFSIAARYLEDEKMYAISKRLLDKFIASMPENTCIPPWDFRLPADQPAYPSGMKNYPEERLWDVTDPKNAPLVVDTSAAVIAALGAWELNAIKADTKLEGYIDGVLEEICAAHLNDDKSVQGVMKHQNGSNVYTMYGDYYFFELLTRKLFDLPTCW